MDWVVTVPKTILWENYLKELKTVEDGTQVLNYRVRFFPKEMKVGDRCFIVHDGSVRGWMSIVGLRHLEKPWQCTTTKIMCPSGNYIQRSGKFNEVRNRLMVGFRGLRKYHENS